MKNKYSCVDYVLQNIKTNKYAQPIVCQLKDTTDIGWAATFKNLKEARKANKLLNKKYKILKYTSVVTEIIKFTEVK